MKTIALILGMSLLGTNILEQGTSDARLISELIRSKKFTISIEYLDLGYMYNKQFYHFSKNDTNLTVTHKHLIRDFQDSTLKDTEINFTALDSLTALLTSMKTFEIENPRKFTRLFNKSDVSNIIYLTNSVDSVIFSDVQPGTVNKFHSMIKRNRSFP